MPIKRNPAIVRFSRDHHFGLLLVWKIREGFRRSIEAERISLYVTKFFENELVPHFRDEEENLFTRLPEDDKMRLQAENDHKKLNELIEHLMNNGNDEIMLSEFADLLEKHIRFEERELFNFIQESLTAAELAEIESAHAPVKCSTDSEWKDIFWN